MDCRKLACSRSPVRNRELVGCRACLSLAIALLVEVLRIRHRLYLECDSVVDGTGMPTTGNSSQGNLTIEMSDFQLYRFRAAWCNRGIIRMISLREAKQRNSVPPDNCAGVGFKAYRIVR